MKSHAIISICIGFLIGVTAYDLNFSVFAGALFVVAIFVVTLFLKIKGKWICAFLFLLLILFGFSWSAYYDRTHASQLPEGFFNKKVTIVGDVVEDPDIGIEKTKVVVMLVKIGKEEVSADLPDRVLIRLGPGAKISYGDRIEVSGIIERPENFITETEREFDYEKYLALHDVYGITKAFSFEIISRHHENLFLEKIYSIKKYFVKKLLMIMPSPESGLLAGIMIGEKSLLPKDILSDFQSAGLTHMIVLSGYNVTIVALTIVTIFSWLGLGYRGRRIGALIVIPIFILMTGLDASAVRAGVMAMIAFTLQIMTRPASSFRVVVMTLSIMVFLNPRTLLHDPSLHLSYLAFLGLIYMTPVVAKFSVRFGEWWGMRDLITETFAVQLFVMPYILWMNGQASVLLLIANIVTVPLSPIAMGVGFFATLGATAFYPLGYLLAIPVKLLLSYIIWVAHVIAAMDFFTFTIPPFGAWWMIVIYCVMATGLIYIRGREYNG